MPNFPYFHSIKLTRAKAAILLAATILLVHDFYFTVENFNRSIVKNFSAAESQKFFLDFSLHFFLLSTFFFFCSFNKIIFRSAAFILFLFSTTFAFFYNKFGIILDQAIIANAMQNKFEATNLINFFSLFCYFIFLVVLPEILVFKTEFSEKNNHKNFTIIAIIFIFFAAILASIDHQKRKGAMIAYPPINIIDSIAEYFSYVHDSLKNKKPLKPISQIVPDAKNDSKKIKNLKIILIIGESARAKNFAINGYERQTTPQLEKVKNLLSFKNVSTPYNLTSDSVSSMLSSHTQKNFQPSRNDEESIIKLFEKLGYSTAWFSAQKAFGDDNALIILAMQAQKHFFSNSISKKIGGGKIYDEYLLEFLDKEIDNDRDNFVILHAQGSHFLYFERYPQKFEKFTPTCKKTNPKECSKEELTNAYDNSILYSDYFISEIINRLKNKNAILFYISDHGQFLGENGLYYHGNTGGVDYEEHKVPLFLWMSESVLKQQFYHKKFNKAATKTETTLSSNNLFDSLLDCSGVDSKLFERKMSLCK